VVVAVRVLITDDTEGNIDIPCLSLRYDDDDDDADNEFKYRLAIAELVVVVLVVLVVVRVVVVLFDENFGVPPTTLTGEDDEDS